MEQADIELRNATYALFVALGRAPTPAETARTVGSTASKAEEGWRRLHEAHALVLDLPKPAIRMANPFSAVPTSFRVSADGRDWYANCAWDAFGICVVLQSDGRIEATCPDCGDEIQVEVRGNRPDDESLLFHCLVPAAHWWDDIVFT
ncbi:MAG TPA: organomercurial lyase [Gaiellaceae bacterium]|nr:organomercurial lyase [Gaiellaceae bacterium]